MDNGFGHWARPASVFLDTSLVGEHNSLPNQPCPNGKNMSLYAEYLLTGKVPPKRRFPLTEAHRKGVAKIIQEIRELLPDLSPPDIRAAGALLLGLERLPYTTEGLHTAVSVSNGGFCSTLSLTEDTFECSYTESIPSLGGGTDFSHRICFYTEVGGFLEDNYEDPGDGTLEEWQTGIGFWHETAPAFERAQWEDGSSGDTWETVEAFEQEPHHGSSWDDDWIEQPIEEDDDEDSPAYSLF